MAETDAVGVITYQTLDYDNVTMSFMDESVMTTTAAPGGGQQGGSSRTTWDVVVVSSFMFIFVLAVVGNTLVVVTLIQNKRMRSVTNIFLFSLSVSDLLFICVCLPFTLVGFMLNNFIFGAFMCKFISYTMGEFMEFHRVFKTITHDKLHPFRKSRLNIT